MNQDSVALGRYFCCGFALAFSACSGESLQTDTGRTGSADDVQTAAVGEAIIGGNDASLNFATSQGFVAIKRSGFTCTGTMLRPDVAVTAKHCTTTNVTINGPFDEDMSHYRVFMNPSGDASCPSPPGACQSR